MFSFPYTCLICWMIFLHRQHSAVYFPCNCSVSFPVDLLLTICCHLKFSWSLIMDSILLSKSLPLGFRFHPTDDELFLFYLKGKVLGKSIGPQMMSEVDVYKFAPWELPAKACIKTRDLNWYFLCPRSKNDPDSERFNRVTVHGYWKSTGIDRTYNFKNRTVGKIKTLVFHRGKAPKGERTNWVMHEYRLEDKTLLDKGIAQDSYVICKIYEKSGSGPKNGECYGAPFVEEEWESDSDDSTPVVCNLEKSGIAERNAVSTVASTVDVGQSSAGPTTPSSVHEQPCAALEGLLPNETEEDEIEKWLRMFTEKNGKQKSDRRSLGNGLGDSDGSSSTWETGFDWSKLQSEDYSLDFGAVGSVGVKHRRIGD